MTKIEIGKVYKNHAGEFTKVTDYKNGFVYYNGWHFKKETAEETVGGNGAQIVNEYGFERALTGNGELTQETVVDIKASDAVKAFATENAIDLATVVGTGAGGNIVKADVVAAIKAREAEVAAMVDYTITEETLDEFNAARADGMDEFKVGDVVKLSPEHPLLKG